MNLNALPQIPPLLLFLVYVWSLFWKGLSLWKAANLGQRNWFVALLVLNTLGILEIIYLFVFAKKKMTIRELMFWR